MASYRGNTKEMTMEDYDYKDKQYRRTATVIKAIEKIEDLEKKIVVARDALTYAKEFYHYLQMKSYPIAVTEGFKDDLKRITEALEQLNV